MAAVVALGLRLSAPISARAPEGALRQAPVLDALRLRPLRSSSLALCLLAGACLQFPLAEIGNLLHHHVFGMDPLEEQLARQALIEARGPLAGAVVVVCLVALVPMAEEALFRGLFMFGFADRYGRRLRAAPERLPVRRDSLRRRACRVRGAGGPRARRGRLSHGLYLGERGAARGHQRRARARAGELARPFMVSMCRRRRRSICRRGWSCPVWRLEFACFWPCAASKPGA